MKTYIPDDHDYRSKARIGRVVSLSCYLLLIGWFSLGYLYLLPVSSSHPWVIWLIHILPLIAFMPVMITGRPRGHVWLCFVLLMLFMEAVLVSYNEITRYYGLGYVLLVSVLFISSMLYARWKSRYDKQILAGSNKMY